MTKQVTSFDVAKLAGVSQPTVSRAMRNLPGASPGTRARVLAAAAQLSYIVNDSARVLSTTKTRRVAVVSEELSNPYYAELVEHLRRRLGEFGLRAVVVADTERAEVTLDALADGSYDGVILTTTSRRSTMPRDLTERGVPHVLVNRVLDQPESHSCAVDNLSGMTAIADLLADLGHRKIAAIHGPVDTSTGRERADTLAQALRKRGIRMRRAATVRTDFGHDEGFDAAVALFSSARRPTAVVCGNDVIALGALSAARTLCLRVPEDVSIVGFDDIPMASWPLANLTTVRCDLETLANTAVDLLEREISSPGRTAEEVVRVPVSLVERGTHAAPAGSAAGRSAP